MLNLVCLLTVLQIFLRPGDAQADINQRNYQPNFDEANSPQWSYKVISSFLENHPHRHVKPCISRKMLRDPSQEIPNVEWIPTFKATITKPLAKDFISQSLKEEDYVSDNNLIANTRDRDLTSDQKLSPLAVNTARNFPSKQDDSQSTITNQNLFRRKMSDSGETIDKQIHQDSSQEDENISKVNVPEISDECNERKATIFNSRRSDSNNLNLSPVFNEKNNNTKDRSIIKNDERDESNSFASIEERNYNNNDEQERTKGYGVTKMSDSSVMLMHNSRTCFACSSASDPSCWHPSRRTTIKYCRKGHDACITRTFTSSHGLVLTRDCGRSCEDISFPGVTPNYKSCLICHNDLCNSAFTVKSNNLIFIILLISIIKYLL